jgi:hypothetical protein
VRYVERLEHGDVPLRPIFCQHERFEIYLKFKLERLFVDVQRFALEIFNQLYASSILAAIAKVYKDVGTRCGHVFLFGVSQLFFMTRIPPTSTMILRTSRLSACILFRELGSRSRKLRLSVLLFTAFLTRSLNLALIRLFKRREVHA